MKVLAILLTLSFFSVAVSVPAEDKQIRPDIDKDIPLAEAIQRSNEQFPDAQPLTEAEVITAVRAMKMTCPDLPDEIRNVYLRVVQERVLPKDMYFSQITRWNTEHGLFRVDWRDLSFRGRIANAEEKAAILLKNSRPNVIVNGPVRVGGFGYRIRTRFVSTEEPNEATPNDSQRTAPGKDPAREAQPRETPRP